MSDFIFFDQNDLCFHILYIQIWVTRARASKQLGGSSTSLRTVKAVPSMVSSMNFKFPVLYTPFSEFFGFTHTPTQGLSTAGITPVERSRGLIEFKGVKFRYPARPDVCVCDNYSLTIRPGDVVALVGPSGSGKSTIINLLLRFYDPQEGEILLDGIPIKDLNVRWLRNQISMVGQEPVLFAGSVSSNIARGRMEDIGRELQPFDLDVEMKSHYASIQHTSDKAAVDADIVDASKSAFAYDFIQSFPNGFDTDVGQGSIMVSGGQKQRIAIARALIKRPAVLLLDEATSALDANSERLVQQSIDELQKSKTQTTIVIAHRLSTIRNADKIFVIDKGAIVSSGTHDELLRDSNGLYATLWNKQQG